MKAPQGGHAVLADSKPPHPERPRSLSNLGYPRARQLSTPRSPRNRTRAFMRIEQEVVSIPLVTFSRRTVRRSGSMRRPDARRNGGALGSPPPEAVAYLL